MANILTVSRRLSHQSCSVVHLYVVRHQRYQTATSIPLVPITSKTKLPTLAGALKLCANVKWTFYQWNKQQLTHIHSYTYTQAEADENYRGSNSAEALFVKSDQQRPTTIVIESTIVCHHHLRAICALSGIIAPLL